MKALFLMVTTFVLFACGREGVPNSGPAATTSTPPAPAAPAVPEVAPASQSAMGTINGGGGVGLRCGSRLEMLDLYEARQSGLTPLPTPASKDAAAKLVADRIATHFWNVETIPPVEHAKLLFNDIVMPIFEGRPFHNYEAKTMESVHFVKSLALSNDYGNYVIPPGCHLEQIAYYSDAATELSIVQNAWNDLDWMSKSVLVTHELLYMIDRRDGLEKLKPIGAVHNSEAARKFVARLLSGESLPPFSSGVPAKDEIYYCSGGDEVKEKAPTYFYAFNDKSSGRLTLVFNGVYGASGLYQLRAEFKTATVENLTDDAQALAAESTTLESVGSKQKSEFMIRLEKKSKSKPLFKLYFSQKAALSPIGQPQEITCNHN